MNDKTRPVLTRRGIIRNAAFGALGFAVAAGLAAWALDSVTAARIAGVALTVGVIWLICWPFTSAEPVRAEGRRFLREFFPAIAAYVVIVAFAGGLMTRVESPALRWALALVPVLPIAWVIRAMLRMLLASDELEQRIQLQAIAIAAVSVGLGSLAAGFVVAAGLVAGAAPAQFLIWVFPAMFAIYGIAGWWIRRGYAGA